MRVFQQRGRTFQLLPRHVAAVVATAACVVASLDIWSWIFDPVAASSSTNSLRPVIATTTFAVGGGIALLGIRTAWRRLGLAVAALGALFAAHGTSGLTIFVEDVTQRQEFIRELEFRALHDALTQLPNRTLLHDRLTQELRNCDRGGGGLSPLLVDLDDCKAVNDTSGHDAGDELLRQIGKRFELHVRDVDTVARPGGDEFAIFLPGASQAGAARVARTLIDSLHMPFEVENDGQKVDAAATIGIAVYPTRGRDAGTLLRYADIAMYAPKRQQESYAIYAPIQETTNVERLVFTTDLRSAIERHAERREIRNRLPIDEVKIDRAFVGTLDQDARSTVIVKATIELAHNLGMIAVAEGVEREETRLALRTLKCDRYQGFLFTKALPPDELVAWLGALDAPQRPLVAA